MAQIYLESAILQGKQELDVKQLAPTETETAIGKQLGLWKVMEEKKKQPHPVLTASPLFKKMDGLGVI